MMAVSIDELGRLYRERYPRFFRLARAMTGEDELALDAVQEAFARAIRSRMSFRGEAAVETWVWRTLINVCRDQRRPSAAPVEAGEESVATNGHSAAAEFPELRAAIAALPERQRLTLFLFHYADLDQERIAEIAGVKRGTVAATLHQAHGNLRRALTEVAHEL